MTHSKDDRKLSSGSSASDLTFTLSDMEICWNEAYMASFIDHKHPERPQSSFREFIKKEFNKDY